MPQKTLAGSVICTGVSLHAGTQVSMEFKPAPADTGIVFHVHAEDGEHLLSLRPEAVSTTELATTISNGKVSVSTIEHVLSSLRALDIDNVEIHVVGCEVPLLDGSAKLIVEALDKAGIVEQDAPRRMMRVTREFVLEQNGKAIAVKPYDGFRVDYTIRFPHPVIGEQRFVLDISPETFRKEIANARTFGFFREAEYLRSPTSSCATRYWTSSATWPCSASPCSATSRCPAPAMRITTPSCASSTSSKARWNLSTADIPTGLRRIDGERDGSFVF